MEIVTTAFSMMPFGRAALRRALPARARGDRQGAAPAEHLKDQGIRGQSMAGVGAMVAVPQRFMMLPRRGILMAACGCVVLAAMGAYAADASAKSFVEGIYAAYKGKDARGVALDSDAAVRRYFEPKLAALILKDRREARGEVDKLDADPFVDAQDWEIDAIDIAIQEVAPDKASATVSFKSLGDQRKIILALVKLRMGWRIADITWDRNGTLRELMSK